MAITRWDPWHDVLSLQNRINSLFQDLSRNQGENDVTATTAGFVPPADIYEDEHQIVLKLEKRAEAKPKQIKVSVGQSSGTKQIESKKPAKEAAA